LSESQERILAEVAVKEAAVHAAEAAIVAAAAAKEAQKQQECARLLSVALACAQSRCDAWLFVAAAVAISCHVCALG
jgi:hypothetical protein